MRPPSTLLRLPRLTWMAGIVVSTALLGSCGSSATTALGPSIPKCATTSASPGGPLPADGGTSTLTVTALPECTWTASTKAPWIADLVPTSGQGNGQIQFKALANTAPNSRDGEVIINDQIVRVQQAAAACAFTVTPSVASIDASGGTFRFVVTTLPGCSWSASSAASWINIAGANERSGPTTIDLTIEPNAGEERSATASVAGRTITVTQAAISAPGPTAPCTYALIPNVSTVGAEGGAVTISLQTQQGCQWTVSGGAPWLQLAGASTGTGSTTISLVAAGNTGSERVSSVTIAGQVVTITQLATASAPVCTFAISPGSATLSSPGATVVAVAVSAGSGCQWSATNTTPWVSIQSGSAGSGNGTVALAITDNTTASVRSAVVTIAGQAFSISQAGLCSYSVSPTSASVPATGGTGPTITVATAGTCGWSASTTAAWLTIASGSSGSGNGTVTLTATANAGAPRSGTLTIAGQTVTVTQSGACGLSVTPTTASAPATGATGQTVVVTGPTGCPWSATSNAAWLTITGGGSGSGNGTVVYSAAANTGAARSGTLTVGGQTVTVNQAGGCAISLSPTSAALPSTAGAGPAITVTTASTCSWTAVPDANWITISSGANGSGNGTIGFSVTANTGPARSGAINVSGATFQVTQASGCTFSLAPSSQSIGAGGGAATPIAVTTTAVCSWSATTAESWATISSGQSGSGNGTVSVTVLANPGPARSAALSIGNATATISQASGCVFTVSPTEFALTGQASTGLTISVSSASGCTWTAVTTDSWITVTSTGTGRGDGTVRFNVSENAGGTRRGSLTVAGIVVEIRQASH